MPAQPESRHVCHVAIALTGAMLSDRGKNGAAALPSGVKRRAEQVRSEETRRDLLASHHLLQNLRDVLMPVGPGRAAAGGGHWSVTRRSGYVAAAVSRSVDLGVDLEVVSDDPDCVAVAASYFPAAWRRALSDLPPENRPFLFTSCWSALEAVAKARSTPLEEAHSQVDQTAIHQAWLRHHDQKLVLTVAGAGAFIVVMPVPCEEVSFMTPMRQLHVRNM